ncbi:MAG: RNA polymerase sigma factor, partial [Streptosporangiaceae bacterium]
MDESDGELLAATARGDGEAFGRFYRRHEQRVLSYAIARCANATDVADVAGETFLVALGSASRFSDDGGDAIPWLFGIARRVLAHHRRSFTRRQRLIRRLGGLPSLGPDEAAAVEAAIDASRLAPQLAAALATLRPKDQELLRLVGGDGLSPAQAGAVLGMNPNTARVRLSRARARLRGLLAIPGTPHPRPTRIERRPMFDLEDHPSPPAIPRFSQAMEQSLVAAARASSARRPPRAARLGKYAAAGIAAAAVAVGAGVGIDHAVGTGRPVSSRAIISSLHSGVSCRRAGLLGWCSSSCRETRGAAGAGPRM